MKRILLISLLFISISSFGQDVKARLDTLNGRVTLTDEMGVKYEVFRSENGYSSIIKEGKQVKIFRREKAVKPRASELSISKTNSNE